MKQNLCCATVLLVVLSLGYTAAADKENSTFRVDIDPDGPCKADLHALCPQFLEQAGEAKAASAGSGNVTTEPLLARRHLTQDAQGTLHGAAAWLGKFNMSRLLPKSSKEFVEKHADLASRFGFAPHLLADSLLQHRAPLAHCLSAALRQAKVAISPLAHQVSDACKHDVRAHFARKFSSIRHDVSLLLACAADIKLHCPDAPSAEVPGCLKAHKPQLSVKCAEAVTTRQIQSSEDITLDPELNAACAKDREALCSDKGWGGGVALRCLEKRIRSAPVDSPAVSPECKAAVFKRRVHDSEDIRFQFGLSLACAADKAHYCGSVQPGKARVIDCLEKHKDEIDFSRRCKYSLEKVLLAQALDARLDFVLRTTCVKDVQSLCPELSPLLEEPTKHASGGDRIYECLRNGMGKIKSGECEAAVYKHVARGFKDNRMDVGLLRACHQDIDQKCQSASSAIECLRGVYLTQKGSISERCKDVLEDRAQLAFQDISLHPGISQSCAYDLQKFCKGVDTRGGAAVQCLQDHMQEPTFHATCHREVEKYLMEAVEDIRLISSLRDACQPSISELCADVEPGQGRVIYCLQSKRKDITSGACRNQLLRMLGLASQDYRMDYILYKACQADASAYCADVEPQGGHVNECLRAHEEQLSEACKHMQERLEEFEHEDVRVNARLKRACSGAVSRYCKDVDPHNAQQLVCLQQHQADPEFFPECHGLLSSLQARAATRWHLNPRLKHMCSQDAQNLCGLSVSDQLGRPDGSTSSKALECLADHATATSHQCHIEIVHSVRYQLRAYRVGTPLTSPCDGDAMQWCHADTLSAPLVEQGYIADCLAKHATELTRSCWSIISLSDLDRIEHASKSEQAHFHEHIPKDLMSQIMIDINDKLTAHEEQLLRSVDSGLLDKIRMHVESAVRRQSHGPGVTVLVSAFILVVMAGATAISVLLRSRRTLVVKQGSL